MPVRIPLGNFGNVMPQAQPGRVLDTGAGQVAQAVNTLGQVGSQVAVNKFKEQQKVQEDKDEYTFSVESAKFGAEYSDAQMDVKKRISLGELSHAEAEAELQTRQKQLYENSLTNIPQSKQERFKALTEQAYYRSTAEVKPLTMKQEMDTYISRYNVAKENTLKIGDRDFASSNYESLLRNSPHLTEAQKTEEFAQWNKRRDLLDFDYKFNGIQSDNDALKTMQKEIKNNYKFATAEQQSAMGSKIQDQIERNQTKAYENAKRHEREIESDVSEFTALASTGRPIDPTYLSEMTEKVKGTKYESVITRDLKINEALRSFGTLSLTEQEKQISALKAQAQHTPIHPDSIESKIISSATTILSQNQALNKEDSVAFYKKQTGVDLYRPSAVDIIKGTFDPRAMQLTIKTLNDQKQRHGSGTLITLTPDELVVLQNRYKDLSPKDKAIVLRNLDLASGGNASARKELVSAVVGEKRYYEMMSTSYLQKENIRFNSISASNGKSVSESILEGYEMIDKGLSKGLSPSAEEFNRAFALAIPKNLVPGTPSYGAAYNNVLASYLSLQKDNGGIEYDSKGRVEDADEKGFPPLNQGLFTEAFDAVTGGTYSQKLGSAVNKVARPLKVSEESMKRQLETGVRNAHRADQQSYVKDFLRLYAITPTNRPYTYQFTLRGETYELGGKPLEITIKPE